MWNATGTSKLSTLRSTSELRPFHIAFPVDDLVAARHFYGTVLGCPEGRSADTWIDFDLFGHEIVAHFKPKAPNAPDAHTNAVDGHAVPVQRDERAGRLRLPLGIDDRA